MIKIKYNLIQNLITHQGQPMHQGQPQNLIQPQQQTWQVYQPQDETQSVFKIFNSEIKNVLKLIIISFTLYLVLTLLSPITILMVCLFCGTLVKLVKIKTDQIKKEGLANKFSPKLRQLLFQKSIFDIYSDILYFPLISKIIAAFVKPLIVKPHPARLHQTFQQLPFNIQKTIARKGLLSLAPQKVQQIFIDTERQNSVPESFGVETWEWKNFQKYINHHEKVHEQTIGKKIVESIDKKVSWTGFVGISSLVLFGVYKMKPSKFQKILISNGSFLGLLLVSSIALIKIKKRVELAKKKRQNQQQYEALKNRLDKDQ